MKVLMKEIGDAVLAVVSAGAIIAMLLAMLSGGAISSAVAGFMAGIC